MKFTKFIFFTLFFSLFLLFPTFSQENNESYTGIELSNYVYKFAKKNNKNVHIQNLVSKGKNDFPYNVVLEYNQDDKKKLNLLLVINQNDLQKNEEIISHIFELCNKSKTSITILFAYDGNNLLNHRGLGRGSSIYINDELNTSKNNTAIILNFDSNKNSIITSSKGKISPSWMITNIFNLILKNNLNFNLPPYYLSQLYRFNFSRDELLDEFFAQDIPAIKISFANEENIEKIQTFISGIIELFENTSSLHFDQHFMIVNIFGRRYINFNELIIVHSVILSLLGFLVFIFLLFFIDAQRRNDALKHLRHNWHPLLFVFIMIIMTFFLGKTFFLLFQKNFTSITKILTLYSVELLFSLVISFFFFIYEFFHNQNLSPRAIDYTIIISTFINQFIFLYIDISLFPIFALLCIMSTISRYIKKTVIHIPMFILMALPVITYVFLLFKNTNLNELKSFLLNSDYALIAISLILCPFYLKIYRIFIDFAKKTRRKKKVIKYTTIGMSAFSSVLIIGLLIVNSIYKKTDIQKDSIIRSQRTTSINCSWKDTKVFDDIIRNLNITIPENTIYCDVVLDCENSLPVLYSDNSYEINSSNSAIFLIPENPPAKLNFTYGTSKEKCRIIITVICPDINENQFIMQQKTVMISS